MGRPKGSKYSMPIEEVRQFTFANSKVVLRVPSVDEYLAYFAIEDQKPTLSLIYNNYVGLPHMFRAIGLNYIRNRTTDLPTERVPQNILTEAISKLGERSIIGTIIENAEAQELQLFIDAAQQRLGEISLAPEETQ